MTEMVQKLVFSLLWLFLYGYFVERMGTIQKGRGKRLVLGCLGCGFLLAFFWVLPALSWGLLTLLFLLYDLFYDEEGFRGQWRHVLLAGGLFSAASLCPVRLLFAVNGGLLWVLFLMLAAKRSYLKTENAVLTAAPYVLVSVFLWWLGGRTNGLAKMQRAVLEWGSIAVECCLFWVVESTLFSYKKSFEVQTEQFQREVMGCQYEEIRGIYMNMRGWRHDYHNHLQVIKAQLALGKLGETKRYLDALERDLDRVDTYVKSGNLMVDAILNSKLSLAQKKRILVNCKAQMPEKIPVEDVDLCVILGNLLDNALEACEQIGEERRFLRIYMHVNKSQFYLSVQNAAKEELDFNERNYISQKRGSHGLGMKRVRAAVEKYDGYMHLANEPGIFAAEVTMPLPESGTVRFPLTNSLP